MDWKAHTALGAVFAFAAAYVAEVRDFPELIFLAFFGALSALLPDLDHESSKGKKILDSMMVVFALVFAYMYSCAGNLCVPGPEDVSGFAIVFLTIMGVYFVFFRFFKPRHRGITHTLAACSVFGVLVYFVAGFVPALAGFAGYLSHLVADRHIRLI
jgi:membrane-bound metal-dependent hydrolase YbcI (DUF457 family)